ncbi:MAG: Shufflon-specific DNA recombinase [uncultured Caballeronia sp.]|nr:MAG: Shufflon-specific DNA recombinase [uncultured Caballeronia sp.]
MEAGIIIRRFGVRISDSPPVFKRLCGLFRGAFFTGPSRCKYGAIRGATPTRSTVAARTKTPSGTWKATIRRVGWSTTVKTFRTKRDAEDWSCRTKDEMVHGVFIQRGPSERTTVTDALDRYEREIVPTKKASTQRREAAWLRLVKQRLGQYSLAAMTPDLVAKFRGARLAEGKANNTVTITNIRKPSPGEGRDRRLVNGEQQRLLATVELHANPMLGWIVRLAIY